MNRSVIRITWLYIILGAGILGGCASIIDGSHQEVSFNSNPDGATVNIDGRIIGKTPITAFLKKKAGQSLVFSKDGYKPLTMQLETHMDSWFWGNIVLPGGLFGSTTDGISGAINEYSPSQYMVTLQQEGTGPLESNTATDAKQKAKEYIVLTYKNILSDISNGGGQYLTSLFELLKIPKEGQGEATKKIHALSDAYSNIPEFADRVIELYLK